MIQLAEPGLYLFFEFIIIHPGQMCGAGIFFELNI